MVKSGSLGRLGNTLPGYFCMSSEKWHHEFGSLASGHSCIWGQGAIMLASSLDFVLITQSLAEWIYLKPFGLPGSTITNIPSSLSLYQRASITSYRAFGEGTSYSTKPRIIRSNLPLSPAGTIARESTHSTSFLN